MAAAMLAPTQPTSTPSTFGEFLSIATNDHYTGNYAALMQPFAIDGVAAPATPAAVRAQVVEATAQQKAVGLVAFIDGKLQPFFLPFTIKPALGMAEDPTIHNKVHAFWGDLIQGASTVVHLPDDVFNLSTQVQVPTLMSAKILLAADATLEFFGPYAAGDADTETVRTRKVCILPAKYLGYFLSHEEGVTPRQFLEEMQPVIEADGNAIALAPFTTFAISSMTKTAGQVGQGPGPSAVLVAVPASVARNKSLLTHSQFILRSHLTGLGKDGGIGVNLTPLITAINDGHSQAATRANDERQERKAKDVKTVLSMLGADHLAQLLRLCGVATEGELAAVWASMANAPKASRLVVIHNAVQEAYIQDGLMYEHHLPNLSFLNNLIGMSWVPFSDSLEGGSVANPFQFTDTNEEAFHSLNNQLQLIMNGDAAPSLADAQVLLKNKITIPGPDESINILRRMKVLLSVVLPMGHPLTVYLSKHVEIMKSFEQPWANHLTFDPSKCRLKSFHHLKFTQLRFKSFITAINQGRHIPVLDPYEIVDAIQNGVRWEPLITPAMSSRYHLDHFAQLHPPGGPDSSRSPHSPGPGRSPQPPPPTPAGSGGGLVVTPPAGPGGAIVPTPTDNRTVNTSFNETLFGSYKISSIKCKALRDRIVQQTLGALPRSKVNPSDPMCLAWHSKGQCNTNCPCVADHVQYSAAELAPMAAWCVIGYAPPAPAA